MARINRRLAPVFVRRVLWLYRWRCYRFRLRHPDLFQRQPRALEQEHKRFWSGLGFSVRPDWLRFFCTVSGIQDKTYVPIDLFYTRIDRLLNDANAIVCFGDKNQFDRLFPQIRFPETIVRMISGCWHTRDYRAIMPDEARRLLQETPCDIIVKPGVGSCGGSGVRLFTWDGSRHVEKGMPLDIRMFMHGSLSHYIFQKRVTQSAFTAQFNPTSVNTFRVMTLRCPDDNRVVPLKTILRMGVGNVHIDNEASGGISVGVLPDGTLNSYACDKAGTKLLAHPATGVRFAGQRVPGLDKIQRLACSLAETVPSLRLISLDIAILSDGEPCCVEFNTCGATIGFLQTFGGGMFGPYAEQVVRYCRERQEDDQFHYVRTFY